LSYFTMESSLVIEPSLPHLKSGLIADTIGSTRGTQSWSLTKCQSEILRRTVSDILYEHFPRLARRVNRISFDR